MIKYRLACTDGHEFEGWFRNSDAFEAQQGLGHLACPTCGSARVSKAIMAPAIATRRAKSEPAPSPTAAPATPAEKLSVEEIRSAIRSMHDEVRAKAEYVGPRFAEEARKIHDAESEKRGIYGEASLEEVRALAEDGIPCLPLPRLPDDMN